MAARATGTANRPAHRGGGARSSAKLLAAGCWASDGDAGTALCRGAAVARLRLGIGMGRESGWPACGPWAEGDVRAGEKKKRGSGESDGPARREKRRE